MDVDYVHSWITEAWKILNVLETADRAVMISQVYLISLLEFTTQVKCTHIYNNEITVSL